MAVLSKGRSVSTELLVVVLSTVGLISLWPAWCWSESFPGHTLLVSLSLQGLEMLLFTPCFTDAKAHFYQEYIGIRKECRSVLSYLAFGAE